MDCVETKKSNALLDSLAVSMSLLCAVHCLLTPVLIVVLPMVATSFWADSNFHLWMLLLVVPTSTIAVLQGCKKHKDKLVFVLGAAGLALLIAATLYEVLKHGAALDAHCSMCVSSDAPPLFAPLTVANLLGGALLASGHIRNFMLCRKHDCTHC